MTGVGGLPPFRFIVQTGESGRPAIALKLTESKEPQRRLFAARSNDIEMN